MEITRKQALDFVEAVIKTREKLDDKTAANSAGMYPLLHGNGALISHGTRINWNGQLKRAAVDLYDTPENTPDKAPTLWEGLMYEGAVRVIPENISVGLAFSKGEHGMWKGEEYESLADNNVYNPEQYPQNWKKVVKE